MFQNGKLKKITSHGKKCRDPIKEFNFNSEKKYAAQLSSEANLHLIQTGQPIFYKISLEKFEFLRIFKITLVCPKLMCQKNMKNNKYIRTPKLFFYRNQ